MQNTFAGRYYCDYAEGIFKNQKILNEKLNASNYGHLLQNKDANPLTVRLVCAWKSINNLKEIINQHNEIVQSFYYSIKNSQTSIQYVNMNRFGATTVPSTSGSGIDLRIPHYRDSKANYIGSHLTDLQYINGEFIPRDIAQNNFPPFLVHEQIYNFFTNYGSVLDRFSHEIAKLCNLQISSRDKVNWNYLNSKENRLLEEIDEKSSELASVILNFYEKISSSTLEYRNHLVHDGIIRISVNCDFTKLCWEVKITDNPGDEKSPINQPGLILCQTALDQLISFLDNCYGLVSSLISELGFPF